ASTRTTTEKYNSSIIPLGSWLSPEGENTSWPSSSGHFAFGFYPHGNGFAVGIWPASSKRKGRFPKNIDSGALESVYMASMLDSGNFVLYDEHSNVIWQSFDHPTDTILGDQHLKHGDSLISSISKLDHSSGLFYLKELSNGSVVAYPYYSYTSDEDAYWELDQQGFLCPNGRKNTGNEVAQQQLVTGAVCPPGERLYATLCIPVIPTYYRLCFDNSNKPEKKSYNNTTSIYRATLDVDGN
ncbi:G-type lectin S-receptor-like serine/threonine protein kinase RLK1-like, partial [Trifolium medium]|nr:G-type lectin S-receptor-like serine/threonine protein kinase RLK1-like [Trifolium medium]